MGSRLILNTFLHFFIFASFTYTAAAQDLRDPFCDPAYRYVGANIFGVNVPGSFFGKIHGGDSVHDVVCHLQNTPGVTVELDTARTESGSSFTLPDDFKLGKLNGLIFDGVSEPIVKFHNFVMHNVPLSGEVRFKSAASSKDAELLGLAHMRLEQGRRLSTVQPGYGVLADSVKSIYLKSKKPNTEEEKAQFYKDRRQVADMMMGMMEERSIPILQSLANKGSVWFEPTNGVTASIEGRVQHGVEIYITYDVEKDNTRLMRRFRSTFDDMIAQTDAPSANDTKL